MPTNTPRIYSADEVEEFLDQAIGDYVDAARRDADVTPAELERIIDIARHITSRG